MAKPRKSAKQSKTTDQTDVPIEASVEDAVVLGEAVIEDVNTSAEEAAETDTSEDVSGELVESDEPENESVDDMISQETITTKPESRSVFLPMVLGGAVAAGLGFGFSQYVGPMFGGQDDLTPTVQAQANRIAQLQEQLDGLEIPTAAPDLTADVEALRDGLATATNDINATLHGVDARLIEVEKGPTADGSLSETAFAAYDREIADLRAMIEAQTAEMAGVLGLAASSQDDALAAATAAIARAALTRVQAALDVGEPFASALADLEDATGRSVPDALALVSEDGVPTLGGLQDSFPEAARAALAVTRSEETDGGVAGFLKSTLGVRSVEPRAGDDPDAVLSRAEAAVREGRLSDAFAEIEGLPESGRAELTSWMAAATKRSEALSAFAAVSDAINAN